MDSHRLAPGAPFVYCRFLVAALAAGMSIVLSPNGARAAESLHSVHPVRDVPYFDGPDADAAHHKLDLYIPKDEKDFPVLFFVHGGGWRHGDKGFLGVYEALGVFLARHGVGAVVINYRLSPAVQHPEHIRDVARAFAWTYKNIATYGGRPDRIFACGHSAGGHLVALLATDPVWLKAVGLTSAAIRGVIPISGVFDLTELPQWFVARSFGVAADILAAASPTKHASGGLPPFLILYADHDLPGCDRKPAEAFAKALRDKGTKAEAREIVGSNHYKMILSTVVEGDPVCNAILSFIGNHAVSP
jgi:acetyl esterase/lipase